MGSNTDWSSNFAAAAVSAMIAYDDILVPRLFNPFADVLVDGVAVSPGLKVLDVACGPGTVSRLVAPPAGPPGKCDGL